MSSKLEFYHVIHDVVDGRLAIGGSMTLIAHKDPTVMPEYVHGDIDICLSSEIDIQLVHNYLMANGYEQTLDIKNPFMFTVRTQYKRGGEKHDFFIVPAIETLRSEIDGVLYAHPSITWAARGFYAGIGSHKAYSQLVAGGLVNDVARHKYSVRHEITKIVKYIIKGIC